MHFIYWICFKPCCLDKGWKKKFNHQIQHIWLCKKKFWVSQHKGGAVFKKGTWQFLAVQFNFPCLSLKKQLLFMCSIHWIAVLMNLERAVYMHLHVFLTYLKQSWLSFSLCLSNIIDYILSSGYEISPIVWMYLLQWQSLTYRANTFFFFKFKKQIHF